MTTPVKFASKSGSELGGALAQPAGSDKAPAIVVVQEWHGINDYVRGMCDRLAQEGFIALAPDLFHGAVATTTEQASKLAQALDKNAAVAEIGAAASFLKSQPRSSGKIGVLGFCLGGGLALAAARYADGFAAAVSFYGLPNVSPDELARIRVPIEAHFARKDDYAKASVAEELQRKVRAAGGQMDLYVYEAGHAFMRFTDPATHSEPNAKLAWGRVVAFLRRTLA
jgi:carboxymethylenebutenolidase